MSKRSREEPCHICGHFHDYQGGEPCSTCGHVYTKAEAAAIQKASKFPSEILPGRLFLGSFDNASRVELLKAMGITHILCCVPSCAPLYKNSFVYHTVSSSPPSFEECSNFLESVLESKPEHRVLVHCMTGTSRSPSVTIAFLMKLRQWRLMESFKWVKQRRPTVSLLQVDADRLQAAEVQMLGSSSVGWQGPIEAAGTGTPCPGPFKWSWQDSVATDPSSEHSAPMYLPSVPLDLNFVAPMNRGTKFSFGSNQTAMES